MSAIAPSVAASAKVMDDFQMVKQEQSDSAPLGQATKGDEQELFNDPTGKYKLVMKGAYGAVEVALLPDDSVKADTGCMVTMSNNNMGHRGDVLLAPSMPGDVVLLNINSKTPAWCVQGGSFLAADASISVGVRTQGCMQCCFSEEGLFVLKCHGGKENREGRLIVASYGGIVRYDLQPGEVRKIDNGYLVAWEQHLNYRITKASSSILGSMLSGEGVVCSFTGPGTVYVQTRSIKPLAACVAKEMKPK